MKEMEKVVQEETFEIEVQYCVAYTQGSITVMQLLPVGDKGESL